MLNCVSHSLGRNLALRASSGVLLLVVCRVFKDRHLEREREREIKRGTYYRVRERK